MTMGDKDTCQVPWELSGKSSLAYLLCDSFLHLEEGKALSLGAGDLGSTP